MQATKKALILVYTGNGKGKTCAAMGQLARALGHGMRCAVAQFLKADPKTLDSGEFRTFGNLGVRWQNFGCGFSWEGDNDVQNARLAAKGWEQVKRWISSGSFDMIVLDEFTYTLSLGYLDEEATCLWLEDHRDKDGFPHLVITGRDASARLTSVADMVSDIREVRHHLTEQGQTARKGIEF